MSTCEHRKNRKGIAIGIAIGTAVGVLIDNLAIGVSLGLVLGHAVDLKLQRKRGSGQKLDNSDSN